MRKVLEFPQIDEQKLEFVQELIDSIAEKVDEDCRGELNRLNGITGKEHTAVEFAEYWGWTDLESLARIYGNSIPGLPTIEFPKEYEADLRRIAQLQGEISEHNSLARKLEKEVEAHSVRIAELMKEHEYGVLETTSDKLLIDFVTKSKTTTDKDKLKEQYPTVFDDVQKTTHSRKLKVSVAAI